jgi:ADP-ribose pyrophosphatase YjhB (NUDIX family)
MPVENITRELWEESGLKVTWVHTQPSYMVVWEKDDKRCWVAHIFYETTVQDLNFTASDECQELWFFSKDEALQLPIYSTVKMFFEQMGA